MDFMQAGMNQCAGRPDGEVVWWALILSNLIAGLLLSLILKWSGAKGIVGGLSTGALFGLLYSAMVDLSFWSMTTMFHSIQPLVADILAGMVVFALVGMVITLTWGRK